MGAIKEKLTDTSVTNLKPDPIKMEEYQDTSKDAYGLMLRVNPGGKKTYFVYGRIKGESEPKRFTIIDASKIRIHGARKIAQEYHLLMASGKDPIKHIAEEKTKEEREHGKDPRYASTLRQVFEQYLRIKGVKPDKPSGLSPETVDDYTGTFRRYLSHWSNVRLIDITGQMVSEHHAYLADKGLKRAPDKMAVLLRAIFNYAIGYLRDDSTPKKDQLYTYNPVSVMDAGQWTIGGGQSQVKANAIIYDHLPAIWQSIEYLPSYKSSPLPGVAHYYFKFMLFTGIRPGSAAKTEWHQLDLQKGCISYLNKDARKVKGNKEIFELPLSDYVLSMLEEMHAKREKGQSYLFPNAGGGGHVAIGMSDWGKKICKSASGLGEAVYTAHDYRATFATVADAIGLNEWTIKRLMNHSTLGSKDITAGYIRSEGKTLRKHTQAVTNEILRVVGEALAVADDLDGFAGDLVAHAMEEVEGTAGTVKGILERWARLGYLADSMADKTTVDKIKKMAAMDMT